MLAILYLLGMIYFGDCICRYFFRFSSIQHRLATSFLVGLLLSSCITYLSSLAFSFTAQPLIWGNLIFLGVLVLAAFKMPRRRSTEYYDSEIERPVGNGKWDWLCLFVLFVFGCWLMFSTLTYQDGNFQFGFKSWSDFGANLSLSQSFLLGHNFPTEHPFFPGELAKYHFLFWFQAANLSFLGLNLVFSINLLSILSLMALLVLIMTFAELLFASRAVARISAILFFFASSSVSYIPFLWNQPDIGSAVSAIFKKTDFLVSGYPFRGEDWGALSVDVFVNQRHLISGVGILFIVFIFIVDFYRHKKSLISSESVLVGNGHNFGDEGSIASTSDEESTNDEDGDAKSVEDEKISTNEDIETVNVTSTLAGIELLPNEDGEIQELLTKESDEIQTETDSETDLDEEPDNLDDAEISKDNDDEIHSEEVSNLSNKASSGFPRSLPDKFWEDVQTVLFCGVLIGALPYWNSAIFASALIVIGSLFIIFPYRLYSAILIGTSVLIGLPQILILRAGSFEAPGQSLFHWGYTIPEPTVLLVLQYVLWTFGFKLLLILVALWLLPNVHRWFFLALSSLLLVVFLLQLSTDPFNNHKLINIWGIFGSIYVAYGLWYIGKGSLMRSILAAFLALVMVFGAIIDLFPVFNDPPMGVFHENDRLTTWLVENTNSSDVFLTYPLLSHPILFTGRKIFMGNTLFAWAAGYNVADREAIYKQMFKEQNPEELVRLLRANNISYVAFDDGLRGFGMIKDTLNEEIFRQNFELVFDDTEHRHANMAIYKVPSGDFNPK